MQVREASALHCTYVHKSILAAVIRLNKAESLWRVKPISVRHRHVASCLSIDPSLIEHAGHGKKNSLG